MNPTNRCTKDNVLEWLHPILQKEGLTKFTINVSGNSEKGDGYLGDVTFVEANGKTSDGEEKLYNFVIKSGKKSKELRDVMPIRSAFENEIAFYEKIYPQFVAFQKEKGVKEPFINVPKCYGTLVVEDMEVLVLQNLKENDFAVHDRREPMNREHIIKVIQTYGKLHAISFAMRDQKPDLFKQMTTKLVDVLKLMYETLETPEDYNVFESIIDAAKEAKEDKIVVKAYLLHEKRKTLKDLTDPSDPYAVILHGDCWNNNFMFKYQDKQNNILSDICLIDFQLSRLASPVYDLSYFLFTCLSEEGVNDFDEFVDIYYESLSDFLKKLGSDPDKLFPFEELIKQWKKFSLFGLSMVPSILKICLAEEDEVPDLVATAESGVSFAEAFGKKTFKKEDQYRKRTLPIMKLAIEKGFG